MEKKNDNIIKFPKKFKGKRKVVKPNEEEIKLHKEYLKTSLQKKIKIFWRDTGYLPTETYQYAESLIKKLSLEIEVLQSNISPARMESKYGK